MGISQRSIKLLWSAAGGRCTFPDCWEQLAVSEAEGVSPYTIGEMAHICGDRPGANRHDKRQTDAQRDDYQNLILLCPTHHTLIDQKENEAIYDVERLHSMKSRHEEKVLARLDQPQPNDKRHVARLIIPLLEENRASWEQYGPRSELARTQPHNDAAHAVWISERLSTIIPNNRNIFAELQKSRILFNTKEQPVISEFMMHCRSYEQWVKDNIPYSAVKSFPLKFDELIRGLADAGTQ